MLSSWVFFFFMTSLKSFFVYFNHGPKGRRQYFIYSVTQLVRGKDVCVRHVNINQNLRWSFSPDILGTAPRKKCDVATVWLLGGTAYCSWESGTPTLKWGSSVLSTLCILPKWCLSILGHTTSACSLSVLGKEKEYSLVLQESKGTQGYTEPNIGELRAIYIPGSTFLEC